MMSNPLLDKDLIFLNKDVKNYEEIFELLGHAMIEKSYAKDTYIHGLKDRESQYPTGVPVNPIGVAIPHTDASYVNESKIGVMTLKESVPFGVMGTDGEQVDVRIVILLGLSDSGTHLKALQSVIELIQSESFIKDMLELETEEDALNLLNNQLLSKLEEEVK